MSPAIGRRGRPLWARTATKLNNIFDLHLMLQQQRLGIVALFEAVRSVDHGEIDDGPMLRALTYFDDSDREATLPGEVRSDGRVRRVHKTAPPAVDSVAHLTTGTRRRESSP